jgi:uncharacterized membrane protein
MDALVNLSWSSGSMLILATIIILAVFVFWRMRKELRSGFPLKDERTRMVTGRAATYALNMGNYFMIALMLMNILSREFRGIYLLDGWYALIISIMVQSIAFIVFRLYFEREGKFE